MPACTARDGDGAPQAAATSAYGDSMPGAPGAGTTAPGLHAVEIVDSTGFARPVVAGVAEVPDGWRTEGGVAWNRGTNCVTNPDRISKASRRRARSRAMRTGAGSAASKLGGLPA